VGDALEEGEGVQDAGELDTRQLDVGLLPGPDREEDGVVLVARSLRPVPSPIGELSWNRTPTRSMSSSSFLRIALGRRYSGSA